MRNDNEEFQYQEKMFLIELGFNNIVLCGRIDTKIHSTRSIPSKYPLIMSRYRT